MATYDALDHCQAYVIQRILNPGLLCSMASCHVFLAISTQPYSKVASIQTAASMGIQRYVFYSIDQCEKHREVPLMDMKYATEEYLKASGLNYTVLRLCGGSSTVRL